MATDSLEYYRQREARQQALADAARDPNVAAIHLELARSYRDRIDRAGPAVRA